MLIPFILVLTAAIWDLRVFTAYRTDVAREVFVVAELIANGGDWSSRRSVEHVIEATTARLAQASAGVLHVAVVRRGPTRHDTSACVDDDAWCAPQVARAFYNNTFDSGRGGCGNVTLDLPPEGDLFRADQVVLPFEDRDPDGPGPEVAPTVDAWPSRNMQPEEWWVVVESCSHFGEGSNPRLIGGKFMNMSLDVLDVTPLMRRRSVWGSIDDYSECDWCR